MNNITLYGIKNCDTIKKAKKWLEQNNIEYTFHDYRQDGLSKNWLSDVLNELDWQLVLNKRGTTYRQLDDTTKENMDKELAFEELLKQPAMIKRPILEYNDKRFLGFKDAQYQEIFKANN